MAPEKKKRDNRYLKEAPIKEIVEALGVSCTRVYQIEACALCKIREGLKACSYDFELMELPHWLIEDWLERFLKLPETLK